MRFIFDPHHEENYYGKAEVGELEVDLKLAELALTRIALVKSLQVAQPDLVSMTYWHPGPKYFEKKEGDIPQEAFEWLDELNATDALIPIHEGMEGVWSELYCDTDTSLMIVDASSIAFRCTDGDFLIHSCEITEPQLRDIIAALEGKERADWMIPEDFVETEKGE